MVIKQFSFYIEIHLQLICKQNRETIDSHHVHACVVKISFIEIIELLIPMYNPPPLPVLTGILIISADQI